MCSAEPVRLQAVAAGDSGHLYDYCGYCPEITLRGDNSHWASREVREMGDEPGWITYDLQRPCVVTRIGFRSCGDPRCPRDVVLQSSEAQAGPWTDVLPFTTRMTRDLQEFDVPMVAQACRYWRVLMRTNHGETFPDIWKFKLTEIRFFGVQQ